MKPEDVRFHHIRDWHWMRERCPRCGRIAPVWHKHCGRADYPANPVIAAEERGEGN